MIGRVLCSFGIHKWMNRVFETIIGGGRFVVCARCDTVRMLEGWR